MLRPESRTEGVKNKEKRMLKLIPSIIGPELLKVLDEMGHGDEIVIADGNFPCASMNSRVIRMDGHGVPEILEAVLKVFPLDHAQQNVLLMAVSPGDQVATPIWNVYDRLCLAGDEHYAGYQTIDRFAFYERAKKAYAVIATSEKALYANILMKKGVVS
jgi:L-fucose mutarotase